MAKHAPWTKAQARLYGRKGGRAPRVRAVVRTPEYRAGYQAGWIKCERFYRKVAEDDLSRIAASAGRRR